MIGLSLAPLPRHSRAGWVNEQLATLAGWLEANGHRWSSARAAAAIRAIVAGDQKWRERAAEVGR